MRPSSISPAIKRSGGGSSEPACGSSSSLLILLVLACLLVFWSFSTHFVLSFQQSDVISADVVKVQSLYEDTRQMMRELVSCSNSSSSSMLKSLNSNAFFESEINKLKIEKIDFEQKFSDCLLEKHRITDELANSGHSNSEVSRTDIDLASSQIIPPPSNSNSNSVNDKWLVVGIPTVSRPNNEDYLISTLRSIHSQIPTDKSNLLYDNVLIAVVHVQPGVTHRVFEQAKQIFGDNPHFLFEELETADVYPDVKVGATKDNDPGNANVPGYRVRTQTRNLAAVMRKVASKGKIYLFLEDDMEFCPHILTSIQYLLHKADMYHPNWLAIRASYGMNGIFMHREDIPVFADYLIANQVRRPPDHLVVEWYAGESEVSRNYKKNRANIGFKYNIFNHIGVVSSLRSAKQTTFPLCYELLVEPTVFQVEAYNPLQCPQDDIWPCKNVKPNPFLNKFKIPWNRLGKN